MYKLTIADLRDIIAEKISFSIDTYRGSKNMQEDEACYSQQIYGPPTEEEIDEFILSNGLFEENTVEQLVDPGFLGFLANNVEVSAKWLNQFKEDVESWASTNSWLGADGPIWLCVKSWKPNESNLWTPNSVKPEWFDTSPTCLLLAVDLLEKGRLLSEMEWRDFEKLIGYLLEKEGWSVEITKATRDGGIDVIAQKKDILLGDIKSIWQAKKYGPTNKVKLHEVRELSAIREEARATKAFIVTTSRLTKDAIEWIKRDVFRLGYKEHCNLEKWIKETTFGK